MSPKKKKHPLKQKKYQASIILVLLLMAAEVLKHYGIDVGQTMSWILRLLAGF